ncbi:MAG: tyrosine-type recombinase/integrase [Acidimicrobiales bacterium]
MSIHRRKTKRGEIRYDVRLYRPDGNEYSKTFRTRREAERYQATERADRARGSWLDPQAGRVTFAEWADEWFTSNSHAWRPRTAEKHEMALRVHWKPRLGHFELSSIRPRQIQALVNDLATGGYSPASIQTYVGTLTALFSDAVDADLVGRSPCRAIRRPPVWSREKVVISPAQLHLLANTVGRRWRCLIYLGGIMGLRFGEAAGLYRSDLLLEEDQLLIRRTLTESRGRVSFGPPKTQSGIRNLSLPAPLARELADHCLRFDIQAAEQLMFASNTGGPIRRSNFGSRVLTPAAKEIGTPGLTFHGLRHSAATQWISDGVDPRTVQFRLGHSDPRLVLKLYAHASTAADRNAIALTERRYWPASSERV